MPIKKKPKAKRVPIEHCDSCGEALCVGDRAMALFRQEGIIHPLESPDQFKLVAEATAICGYYCAGCAAEGVVDLGFEDDEFEEDADLGPGTEDLLDRLSALPDPMQGRGLGFLAVRSLGGDDAAVIRGLASEDEAWLRIRDEALCPACHREMARQGPSAHPGETDCGSKWLVVDQDVAPENASDAEVIAAVGAVLSQSMVAAMEEMGLVPEDIIAAAGEPEPKPRRKRD